MQETASVKTGDISQEGTARPLGHQQGLEGAVLTIVGVGLISGSFALAMKEKGFAGKVIGVSRTEASLIKAKELGISYFIKPNGIDELRIKLETLYNNPLPMHLDMH